MQNNHSFQELTDEQLDQVTGGGLLDTATGLVNGLIPNVNVNVPVALGANVALPLVGGSVSLGVELAPSISVGK